MKEFKVIEVKRSILEDNDTDAAKLREELKTQGTFLLNLMSSPGAGKTTMLKRLISMLGDEMQIGIMEADIDSDVDAQAVAFRVWYRRFGFGDIGECGQSRMSCGV